MLWLTFMVFLTSFRAFRFNTDTRERNRSHYSKTVSGWQESDVTIVVVTEFESRPARKNWIHTMH